MGSATSSPTRPPIIHAPFTPSHPYILSVPISALPYGCACSSTDFLTACIQDPAADACFITKCEYNMSGDLNSHHWLVLWLAGEGDDEPLAMCVWDVDHDLEAKESAKKNKLTLSMWAELFTSALDPRAAYLKTRKNVTTVASQPYDDTALSLLDFALLVQTVQRLYPTLHTPGLPCRWMAHVLFRAMAELQDSPLPAAYIGRIRGFDDAQVKLVVEETRKAREGHRERGAVERMMCGLTVEKKVRERVTLIQLSSQGR